MKRSLWMCALLLGAAGFLAQVAAQQTSAPDPYEGVSNPPPDSTITTPAPQPKAKPSPAKPMNVAPADSQAAASDFPGKSAASGAAAPGMVAIPNIVTGPEGSSSADTADGTDSGIVQVEPDAQTQQPVLSQRYASSDPDGDIVHPAPLPPGTLDVGTTIRARLLEPVSTTFSQDGDPFRAQVASDVMRGGQVLIPVGAEIDGTVAHVSSGHFGGHGSMLLRPQLVILPDGSRYHIYAQLTGAPESNARVSDEGTISPGSRAKKDEIEYGGGVGVGAVTGAVLGGPAGALAGTLVSAGAVTVHLLLDHPQATLKAGTVLDFTLSEPLSLVAANTQASE